MIDAKFEIFTDSDGEEQGGRVILNFPNGTAIGEYKVNGGMGTGYWIEKADNQVLINFSEEELIDLFSQAEDEYFSYEEDRTKFMFEED